MSCSHSQLQKMLGLFLCVDVISRHTIRTPQTAPLPESALSRRRITLVAKALAIVSARSAMQTQARNRVMAPTT
jgi:hypothetical protein